MEILPLISLICFSVVHKRPLRVYSSFKSYKNRNPIKIGFKKLYVTCLAWRISTRRHVPHLIFVSLLLRPSCLSWDFGREGQHFPLSLNCCVLSFDKFCHTGIQVSVKDLDPSIIIQSLNECKKDIERYRHESWMSSGYGFTFYSCLKLNFRSTLPVFKLLFMVLCYHSFTCVCLLFRVFRVTNHVTSPAWRDWRYLL